MACKGRGLDRCCKRTQPRVPDKSQPESMALLSANLSDMAKNWRYRNSHRSGDEVDTHTHTQRWNDINSYLSSARHNIYQQCPTGVYWLKNFHKSASGEVFDGSMELGQADRRPERGRTRKRERERGKQWVVGSTCWQPPLPGATISAKRSPFCGQENFFFLPQHNF